MVCLREKLKKIEGDAIDNLEKSPITFNQNFKDYMDKL